ncbi:hypothetical protein [Leptospira kmetyi]|uniref:DUF1176 domain-containing protein n=1 Tax=Leptospira kmetyi TaxID=408139 RepID=A0ABX4NK38_9LEPT|nr:hypothetical protein [Leptospira kmetyi]PJZ31865.1 hypothetical protein CH378_01255 [Leptospira kmetyi]
MNLRVVLLILIFGFYCTSPGKNQSQNQGQTVDPEDNARRIVQSVLAEEDPPIRNVRFNPKVMENINDVLLMKVPASFRKNVTTHVKDKYTIYSYDGHCGGQDPCLSMLIMVMLIPEKLHSYEKLVKDSYSNDFGQGQPKVMDGWMELDLSGASKKVILYGPGRFIGTSIVGIYYSPKHKMTVQVKSIISYVEPFSDDDWRRILTHNLMFFSTITLL